MNAALQLDVNLPALIRIPAGWFLMGCDSGRDVLIDVFVQDSEKPVHRVWIDEFQLAAHQVTNADYQHFLRSTASIPPPFFSDPAFNHPEQPVVAVSWHEAIRYCEWLAAITDKNFRLPTEAEWERAARGGNKKMMIVDADSGKVLASPAIGEGCDATAFDPELGLAFASAGDGTITVIKEEAGATKFSVAQTVSTQKAARTMTVDTKTHQLFTVTANVTTTNTGTRPERKIEPDSFVVLVVEAGR